MIKQTTNTILMVKPVSFGYNNQTALNNYFQQYDHASADEIQNQALSEFNEMVRELKRYGINVLVVEDTLEPHAPDSIFPNNWISFHEEGTVAIYPMFAENRRGERRQDILAFLHKMDFEIQHIMDYSISEKNNIFLEGTGSMVLDRVNRIAYAAISNRTDRDLFLKVCKDFKFIPVVFHSYQTFNGKRVAIYHTNVMMCIADEYAVICAEAIDDSGERIKVINTLLQTGKKIIDITEKQLKNFAGNMLQVENIDGKKYLIMSQSAHDSLRENQLKDLRNYNEIIPIPVSTIEKYGGGSVRCMMAEIFLTQINT